MSSIYGKLFSVSTWGESHGEAVGAVIDGCPAGIPLDAAEIQAAMDRRRPGQNALVTPRNEADSVRILSGVFEGKTTGTPICLAVWNQNQHSGDYSEMANWYRPGHADLTYDLKYGNILGMRGVIMSNVTTKLLKMFVGTLILLSSILCVFVTPNFEKSNSILSFSVKDIYSLALYDDARNNQSQVFPLIHCLLSHSISLGMS